MPIRLRAWSLSRVGVLSMLTSSSVVIACAAQVLVAASRDGRRRRRQRLAVEPGLQDRLDGVKAEGADGDRSAGGGFQPLVTEALAEAEDAEAGAVALLGMRPGLHDAANQLGRRGPSLLRPILDPA